MIPKNNGDRYQAMLPPPVFLFNQFIHPPNFEGGLTNWASYNPTKQASCRPLDAKTTHTEWIAACLSSATHSTPYSQRPHALYQYPAAYRAGVARPLMILRTVNSGLSIKVSPKSGSAGDRARVSHRGRSQNCICPGVRGGVE